MKQRNIILGFIGACAACCAIPLAAPLFGSAAISAALIGFGESAERGLAFGAAGLLSLLAWRNWRSRRALMETTTGACGCAAPQEFNVRGATPIACTLAPDDFRQRVQWIRDLAQSALRQAHRNDMTLYLTYDRSAAEQVRDMMRKEQACCAFLEFQLHEDADGVHLAVTAPEEARTAAEYLFAHFAPKLATLQSTATQKETVCP
jgi:hypothetical protein